MPEAGKEEDGKIIIIAFVDTLVLERGLNGYGSLDGGHSYGCMQLVMNLGIIMFDTGGPEDL